MNIFERATRESYRFNFRGLITVEDLWVLSVENLDSIFKGLNAKSQEAKTVSLLATKNSVNEELDTKIEIVKYIVEVKLAEQEARLSAVAKKEKKQKILALISEKKDDSLKNMSTEELEELLKDI